MNTNDRYTINEVALGMTLPPKGVMPKTPMSFVIGVVPRGASFLYLWGCAVKPHYFNGSGYKALVVYTLDNPV